VVGCEQERRCVSRAAGGLVVVVVVAVLSLSLSAGSSSIPSLWPQAP
jgi:hypothetical protein